MLKRLARNPSTASLTPAMKKSTNATAIWPEVMAQTMTGTSRIRPRVIRFGRLTRGSRTPKRAALPPEGVHPRLAPYIVQLRADCEPLRGSGILRNHRFDNRKPHD